jgi:hypothetical protein
MVHQSLDDHWRGSPDERHFYAIHGRKSIAGPSNVRNGHADRAEKLVQRSQT